MDPQFARNIDAHTLASRKDNRFRISASIDPKRDRSRPPAEQDPDMLLPVVRETDVARDYPLSNRCDKVEALVIFDDVLIPWKNVLFHRQPRAATLIRATLHRYSAFAFVHRILTFGDMLIGAALLNCRQTGLDRVQGIRDKLVKLAVWREGMIPGEGHIPLDAGSTGDWHTPKLPKRQRTLAEFENIDRNLL